MSSSATDGQSAAETTTTGNEAAAAAGEKQVKFSLPSRSSGGKSKVLARSCSTASVVLGSLSKAGHQTLNNAKAEATAAEASATSSSCSSAAMGISTLADIPEDEQQQKVNKLYNTGNGCLLLTTRTLMAGSGRSGGPSQS